MLKIPLFFSLIFSSLIFPQTKIVYTAVDYGLDEVRATICNEKGEKKYDLGFSKTYLPVWFGKNIMYNSDTYIWMCDTAGENLRQLMEGYKISVSHDKKKFAFYNLNGIGIGDTTGTLIKQILVEPWQDVSITWSRNDEHVSFYNFNKDQCYLFDIKNDSIIVFGDSIYHPIWHNAHKKLVYNQRTDEEKYNVMLRDSLEADISIIVNKKGEMAVVPIWSNKGDKIAYLVIKDKPLRNVDTDMLESNLILYDIETKKHTTLAVDAGFTDQAYPQMSFDEDDRYIYYTSINDVGIGTLKRINLNTLNTEKISKNKYLDERFPQAKTFK